MERQSSQKGRKTQWSEKEGKTVFVTRSRDTEATKGRKGIEATKGGKAQWSERGEETQWAQKVGMKHFVIKDVYNSNSLKEKGERYSGQKKDKDTVVRKGRKTQCSEKGERRQI